jgi:ribosomal protein S18 acetylase RimI-like enzyme
MIAWQRRRQQQQQQQQRARRRRASLPRDAEPPPSRQPSTEANDNTWMRNFRMDTELRGGGGGPATRLTIRPLPLEMLPAAADLLADVFILSTARGGGASSTPTSSAESSPSGSRSPSPSPRPPPPTPPPPPPPALRPSLAPYSRFVRRRIAKYLDDHIRPEARTLVLAAMVEEGEEEEEGEGEGEEDGVGGGGGDDKADLERQRMEDEVMDAILAVRLGGLGGSSGGTSTSSSSSTSSAAVDAANANPPSSSRRLTLVGTAELSLDSSTRSRYLTLNPPEDAAYLMNTAVDARWRRRGVARALVVAADRVARRLGLDFVFLHARLVDPPAVALYRSLGFEVVATDGWWLSLIGQDRRYLMRRTVGNGEGEEGATV